MSTVQGECIESCLRWDHDLLLGVAAKRDWRAVQAAVCSLMSHVDHGMAVEILSACSTQAATLFAEREPELGWMRDLAAELPAMVRTVPGQGAPSRWRPLADAVAWPCSGSAGEHSLPDGLPAKEYLMHLYFAGPDVFPDYAAESIWEYRCWAMLDLLTIVQWLAEAKHLPERFAARAAWMRWDWEKHPSRGPEPAPPVYDEACAGAVARVLEGVTAWLEARGCASAGPSASPAVCRSRLLELDQDLITRAASCGSCHSPLFETAVVSLMSHLDDRDNLRVLAAMLDEVTWIHIRVDPSLRWVRDVVRSIPAATEAEARPFLLRTPVGLSVFSDPERMGVESEFSPPPMNYKLVEFLVDGLYCARALRTGEPEVFREAIKTAVELVGRVGSFGWEPLAEVLGSSLLPAETRAAAQAPGTETEVEWRRHLSLVCLGRVIGGVGAWLRARLAALTMDATGNGS